MAAGDAGVNITNLALGHQLHFLDDPGNGIDSGFDVDHHALFEARRRLRAEPHDDHTAVGLELGHHAGDLGGADVEADNQFLVFFTHHFPFLLSCLPTAST